MIYFTPKIIKVLHQKKNHHYVMNSEYHKEKFHREVNEGDYGYEPIGPTLLVEWGDD